MSITLAGCVPAGPLYVGRSGALNGTVVLVPVPRRGKDRAAGGPARAAILIG
jgi:hypothetical protein